MTKHILVTGASRGIGFETAKYLADNNCTVTVIARSEDRLNELQKTNPDNIYPLVVDITTKNAGAIIKDHLKSKNKKVDGLINNAGLLINKPFMELTRNDWYRQLDVNLLAPVFLIRELFSSFNSGAHIVNIGSMGGFQTSSKFPGLTGYSVAKGALSILTECVSTEFSDYKISCNCLCLGAVQTEMLNQAFPGI
ncbi:MAG: SDR family oxidoreductase, partial [Balneolaceae bacterium]